MTENPYLVNYAAQATGSGVPENGLSGRERELPRFSSRNGRSFHGFCLHLLMLLLLVVGATAEERGRFFRMREIPLSPFEKKESRPVAVYAPLVEKGPVLDGLLNEKCWRRAAVAAPFYKCDDSIIMDIEADVPTRVMVCRTRTHLYLGWILTGEPARKLSSNFQAGGKHASRGPRALAILQPLRGDNWFGRSFRVEPGPYPSILQPLRGDNWFGFYFTPGGRSATRSQRESWNYDADFALAGRPSADGAIIEMAIPFKDPALHAPRKNEWWRFQLGRVDNQEWTAWSNSRGTQETPVRFGYIFFGDKDTFEKSSPPVTRELEFYGESYKYRVDQPTTQFIAVVRGESVKGRTIRFDFTRISSGKETVVASARVQRLGEPKVAFAFDLRGLDKGRYVMSAALLDASKKSVLAARWPFEITSRTSGAIQFPQEGVPIIVHNQDSMPDGAWPVSTGIPLPLGAIHRTEELALYENGRRIWANIVPRASWHVPLDEGRLNENSPGGSAGPALVSLPITRTGAP